MNWPPITKDTPLEEIKRIHQQIWQYTIDHGIKPITYIYDNDCVLCQYDTIMSGLDDALCSHCPAYFNGEHDACLGGMLQDYISAIRVDHDKNLAKRLAEQIRDIPFKYEMKE